MKAKLKNLFTLALLLCLFSSCENNDSKYHDKRYSWNLPNDDHVNFYHGSSDGDFKGYHPKCLDIIKPDGSEKHYEFEGGHSGYENVELRMNKTNTIIWIIDSSLLIPGTAVTGKSECL